MKSVQNVFQLDVLGRSYHLPGLYFLCWKTDIERWQHLHPSSK